MPRDLLVPLAAVAILPVLVASGHAQQKPSSAVTTGADTYRLAQAEPDPALVKRGRKLAARKGCAACHSTDGSSRAGPTWKCLFGRERELADGSTVLADEAYIRESILDPNARIARGFSRGLMPTDFASKLKDDDIRALVAYIKSLK